MGVVDGNKTSGTCRVILGQGVEQVYYTARYKDGTTAERSISMNTDFCNTEDMDVYQHIHITKIYFQNGYSKWRADITESACSNNSGYVNYASYDLPNGDISGMIATTSIVAKIGIVPTGYTYSITISAEKQSLPEYYILTFDANDGGWYNGSVTERVAYGYRDYSYQVQIIENPSRTGFEFLGWGNSNGTVYPTYTSGKWITLVSDLTLYAQWEKNPITGSIECIERTTTSLTFEWEFTPSRSGYIKLTNTKTGNDAGFREVSGTNDSVTFSGLSSGIKYEADLYYYDGRVATWINSATGTTKSNYTMSYDSNIPSGAVGTVTDPPASESFESDTYVTVSSTTLTFRDTSGDPKYRFKGWNTKKDGTGTGYSGGETFQIISNITLYAIWVQQCYICFYGNCNDAVNNIPYNGNKMWYDVGEKFTIPMIEPTRGKGAEWSFLYWENPSIGICSAGVTIRLTESVDLYAIWEQNAKLAKPIVTKSSKDGTSITVSVDKNGGYGGDWEVTAWIDGEYTSTHRYSEEGSPFYITFRNLSPSTLYKIKAVHCVNGVGEKESDTILIRTNIPTFNWTTDDSSYIEVGKDLSDQETSPLKAEKWNELTKLIQTCQTINLGESGVFTSAVKGAEITAQIFNEVADALSNLNRGVMPAKGEAVKVGEDIRASYFAGNTKALKETINGISEDINRKT